MRSDHPPFFNIRAASGLSFRSSVLFLRISFSLTMSLGRRNRNRSQTVSSAPFAAGYLQQPSLGKTERAVSSSTDHLRLLCKSWLYQGTAHRQPLPIGKADFLQSVSKRFFPAKLPVAGSSRSGSCCFISRGLCGLEKLPGKDSAPNPLFKCV